MKPADDNVAFGVLPPQMRQLIECIGYTATLDLLKWRGGVRIYVPRLVTERTQLSRVLSQAAIELLVKRYPGDTIELPKSDKIVRQLRNQFIDSDHAQGMSLSELALKYQLTRRQIINILQRETAPDNQPDLFEA